MYFITLILHFFFVAIVVVASTQLYNYRAVNKHIFNVRFIHII